MAGPRRRSDGIERQRATGVGRSRYARLDNPSRAFSTLARRGHWYVSQSCAMPRTDSPEVQIARVMSHPLRPRILEILKVRGEASPNEIAAEIGVPLGTLSYHTRLLRDSGWIELVREVPRRGAVEHFYRAVVPSSVEHAQWENLPVALRRRLGSMTVGRLLQSAAAAVDGGAFDEPSAHVASVALELDETGWDEVSKALSKLVTEVGRIQDRSNNRRESREPDALPRSTLAVLHFQSD
jgi:DNA-binding transcriptional ArsR family regulator